MHLDLAATQHFQRDVAAEAKERIDRARDPLRAQRTARAGQPREKRHGARAVMHGPVKLDDHALIEIEPISRGDRGLFARIHQAHVVLLAQPQQRDIAAAERAIAVIDDCHIHLRVVVMRFIVGH